MERREAMTVRFPFGLLSRVREVKAEKESLNDLVVEAVDREVRRRQGLDVYESILQLRKKIRYRTGLQPSSVPLIRALRDGEGRRD